MGALEILTKAENSKDLRHYERDCAVDVLGAAGLASAKTKRSLAVYKVKYLDDIGSVLEAEAQFFQWARQALIRKNEKPHSARRLARQALISWLESPCPKCNGLKFSLMKNAPVLSSKFCPVCRGTGKRPMQGTKLEIEIIKETIDQADDAVRKIKRALSRTLR